MFVVWTLFLPSLRHFCLLCQHLGLNYLRLLNYIVFDIYVLVDLAHRIHKIVAELLQAQVGQVLAVPVELVPLASWGSEQVVVLHHMQVLPSAMWHLGNFGLQEGVGHDT